MTKMIAELIEQPFGLPSTAGHDIPAEGELTAILSHRTHRRYTDMPISEDLMQQVLAAGLSAPAKSDLQQVGCPSHREPRRPPGGRRVAAGHAVGRPGGAVFGGVRRFAPHPACLRTARHPVRERPPRCFLECRERRRHGAAKSDPRGKRGRAWRISVIRNHTTRIAELLALPDHVFPLAGLCLGWPSREGFVSMRLPMALTVHVDRYDDTNLEAESDGYDRRRDARHSIPESDWR
jgi:FMN reductase [NAD(P)H]